MWKFEDIVKAVSVLQWAVVDVDADAPENANVDPQLEEGEFIEVFLTPFQGLHKTLVVSPFPLPSLLGNGIQKLHLERTVALFTVLSKLPNACSR